jgi:3-oxoacyl-[acyl-carrier protein] reductase
VSAGRAIVTGGARGIGGAVCTRLRADGYDVVALDLAGGDGVVACDVSDPAAVRRVADEIGPVDVLVNNAAIWRFAALEDLDARDVDEVLATNVRGPFVTTREFGRGMLARGRGAIVNVVSVAALHANPLVGAYSASKAALVALTRQTALEWGPRGIRANAVGPGLVPTEGAGVYHDDAVRAARAAAVPLRRLGSPEEIADVVAFLASDAARYVSGQVLYVDGGLSASLMAGVPRPADVPGPHLDALVGTAPSPGAAGG